MYKTFLLTSGDRYTNLSNYDLLSVLRDIHFENINNFVLLLTVHRCATIIVSVLTHVSKFNGPKSSEVQCLPYPRNIQKFIGFPFKKKKKSILISCLTFTHGSPKKKKDASAKLRHRFSAIERFTHLTVCGKFAKRNGTDLIKALWNKKSSTVETQTTAERQGHHIENETSRWRDREIS